MFASSLFKYFPLKPLMQVDFFHVQVWKLSYHNFISGLMFSLLQYPFAPELHYSSKYVNICFYDSVNIVD